MKIDEMAWRIRRLEKLLSLIIEVPDLEDQDDQRLLCSLNTDVQADDKHGRLDGD